MQNENAKELSLLSALLFSLFFFWCNLCLRFNSISPAGQRYAHPLPDNTYTQRMCSCRWAWTNSESFSRAHATCLSAALGSAHTVRISIRPVGCSLSTLARLRTMQLLPGRASRGQSRCLCSQEFDGAHIRKLTAVEVQQVEE